MAPSVSCYYRAGSITLHVKGAFDHQASDQCICAYERVPCAWRKRLIVVLEGLDQVGSRALETLLYFCERSLNPQREIHLVRCDPLVAQVLRNAGLGVYYHIQEEPLQYGIKLERPARSELDRQITRVDDAMAGKRLKESGGRVCISGSLFPSTAARLPAGR